MSGIISSNSSRHSGLLKASGGGSAVYNLIETQTASSSSTISFTTGIDSTYEKYVFKFYAIHFSTNRYLQVNFRDGGSDFDAVKTTVHFYTSHKEDDGLDSIATLAGNSQAQVTGIQRLTDNEMGTGNEDCLGGYFCLFDPSNTTFIKHFQGQAQYKSDVGSHASHVSGYCNTTNVIDGVQFSASGGTIDSGQISLYGIS